jgi:hypothetical protein
MNTYQKFCEYYKPMVSAFADELTKEGPPERYAKIPELFLPAWGNRYEDSPLRIALIGRDTATWGVDIHKTINRVREGDWAGIFDQSEFRDLKYIDWNRKGTRYTFWGFAMYFLAWLYGIQNWELLKGKSHHRDILSGFAWGNANSIERWDSKTFVKVCRGMSREERRAFKNTHEVVKKASRVFDDYCHFEKLLAPDVVLITCERSDCDRYLANSNPGTPIFADDSADLRVFKIGAAIVVNIPHPQGIMYRRDNHKADYYARELRSVLEKNGMFLPMKNEFLADAKMSSEFLNVFARKLNPKELSTRDAIEQIAVELRKQDACMTVPFLCQVLNGAGFKPNRGDKYLAGRGSYRMLSWFYRHYEAEKPDVAEAIAEAFKKPDGTYAYD